LYIYESDIRADITFTLFFINKSSDTINIWYLKRLAKENRVRYLLNKLQEHCISKLVSDILQHTQDIEYQKIYGTLRENAQERAWKKNEDLLIYLNGLHIYSKKSKLNVFY